MSILKVDYLVVALYKISYSLEPKIEIFLKYFLVKNSHFLVKNSQ